MFVIFSNESYSSKVEVVLYVLLNWTILVLIEMDGRLAMRRDGLGGLINSPPKMSSEYSVRWLNVHQTQLNDRVFRLVPMGFIDVKEGTPLSPPPVHIVTKS